jgi:hypothetical protein
VSGGKALLRQIPGKEKGHLTVNPFTFSVEKMRGA